MSESGDNDDDEHKVGYRKPPVEHQFPPGVSGNPGGRPKRTSVEQALSLGLAELIAEEVWRPLGGNGSDPDMTPLRMALRRLSLDAAQGDYKKLELLLRLASGAEMTLKAKPKREHGDLTPEQSRAEIKAFLTKAVGKQLMTEAVEAVAIQGKVPAEENLEKSPRQNAEESSDGPEVCIEAVTMPLSSVDSAVSVNLMRPLGHEFAAIAARRDRIIDQLRSRSDFDRLPELEQQIVECQLRRLAQLNDELPMNQRRDWCPASNASEVLIKLRLRSKIFVRLALARSKGHSAENLEAIRLDTERLAAISATLPEHLKSLPQQKTT